MLVQVWRQLSGWGCACKPLLLYWSPWWPCWPSWAMRTCYPLRQAAASLQPVSHLLSASPVCNHVRALSFVCISKSPTGSTMRLRSCLTNIDIYHRSVLLLNASPSLCVSTKQYQQTSPKNTYKAIGPVESMEATVQPSCPAWPCNVCFSCCAL